MKERATMKKTRAIRYMVVFTLLLTAFFILMILNIKTGNIDIPVSKILRILAGEDEGSSAYSIIRQIRFPRLLMAAILGGALSVSGFLLQTFFGNPIAGPFVLGISSGAKFAVALNMLFLLRAYRSVSSWNMIAAAFIGALIATGFILLVSRRIKDSAGLLVAGIMVGYICSAATDFLLTFAEDKDIVNLRGWSLGSFSGTSWDNVYIAAALVTLITVSSFLLSKPIDALQLGENYAKSVGVNVRLFRILLIMLSSILSATVTAFAGPISFVGIAVPFLTKSMLKVSRAMVVIPAAFLLGAVFCMGCDLISRCAFAPTELNISTVTGIFGAPIVIVMLIRRKNRK